jgi:ABC-2 type transport system permease protein
MLVIYTLWLRQMRRYFRSRSRVVGAIGQPLLFLLALGYGLGAVYEKAGQGNFINFLTPGVIVQTILFSAIFWGTIIIFDKRFGFLMELLVAPVSRLKVLLGNALGGASISLLQGMLVLVVAIGFGFRPYNWFLVPLALLVMIVLSLALASFGAGIASMVEDFQGFQAINNFIIFPMFFLSSALYPLENVPQWLKVLAAINPITYAVDAMRGILINQSHFSLAVDFAVLGVMTAAAMWFAVNRFNRIQV